MMPRRPPSASASRRPSSSRCRCCGPSSECRLQVQLLGRDAYRGFKVRELQVLRGKLQREAHESAALRCLSHLRPPVALSTPV